MRRPSRSQGGFMRRLPSLILPAVVLMSIPASVAPGFAQTATPTSTSTPGTPTATSTPGTPTATSTPGTPTLTTTPTTALPLALYVPIAVKGVAGDDSGIQVQNISGSAASVAIEYYDQAGNLIASDAPQTVAAGNSVTFYQPTEVGLPFGFDGSAVVRSNQNVAAIVNRANYTASLASAVVS